MITEKIKIECDRCGFTVYEETQVEWRISGSLSRCIKALKNAGWQFIRDHEWRLVYINCARCTGYESKEDNTVSYPMKIDEYFDVQ